MRKVKAVNVYGQLFTWAILHALTPPCQTWLGWSFLMESHRLARCEPWLEQAERHNVTYNIYISKDTIKQLTNCALSKMASTTPAMNALQLSCDSSRGTEMYFVRTGSLSEIMTVIAENWMRRQTLEMELSAWCLHTLILILGRLFQGIGLFAKEALPQCGVNKV